MKKNPDIVAFAKRRKKRIIDMTSEDLEKWYRKQLSKLKKEIKVKRIYSNPKKVWYWGALVKVKQQAKVFQADAEPTRRRYGVKYSFVTGPFKSKTDATNAAEMLHYRIVSEKIRQNPPLIAEEIYSDLIAIQAKKGKMSNWPGEGFEHKFTKGTKVYGLSNGDLYVKSSKGKKLWKKFKYPD